MLRNGAFCSRDRTIKVWAIDGEGKRNAYWQACVDSKSNIHLSWVWRESPDVASNHDMCYAVSKDGGKSWQRSTGEVYLLPIKMSTAEKIANIPQKSELINQTSMCTDEDGNPFIATYWKAAGTVPQYHIIYKKENTWTVNDLSFRKTNFSLSGLGTKQIPISRPQIVCWEKGKHTLLALIFRDAERGDKVSVAMNDAAFKSDWQLSDLSDINTGAWEPTYDIELWKQKKRLHLFVQPVKQADAEGLTTAPPQKIQVVECNFKN